MAATTQNNNLLSPYLIPTVPTLVTLASSLHRRRQLAYEARFRPYRACVNSRVIIEALKVR